MWIDLNQWEKDYHERMKTEKESIKTTKETYDNLLDKQKEYNESPQVSSYVQRIIDAVLCALSF